MNCASCSTCFIFSYLQTVSPTAGGRFSFHSLYLSLLLTELTNHRTLQCVCNMYWSCPPPAIGKVEGARTGDDLVRLVNGGIITVNKCSFKIDRDLA